MCHPTGKGAFQNPGITHTALQPFADLLRSVWTGRHTLECNSAQHQLAATLVDALALSHRWSMSDAGEADSFWLSLLSESVVFGGAFVGLAVVCDDHLVVALETLCLRWNVRPYNAMLQTTNY